MEVSPSNLDLFLLTPLDQFSRKEHEILQKAAEANKKGKRLPQYDEKGEMINPYIPMYISRAPCKRREMKRDG